MSIAQDILAPLLPEFLDAWPAISVQLLVSNRRVDLISEGVDLALRVRTKLDTDAELVVRHLGTARGTLVASPGYLQRHGAPDTPQDLAAHTTLSFSDPQQCAGRCATIRAKRSTSSSSPSCPATTSSCWSRPRCAGVASRCCRPSPRKELRRGQLVPVLPQWQSPEGIVHCIYPRGAG